MRRRALILLVFVVAGSVLAESWQAAAHAAAAGGRPFPWGWPVTLEAFIAVLVLVYWDARSDGRRAPGARTLLLLTTAVAATIQVLDAPRTPLGVLTAAWTPVALLLTVEFATWLLYGALPRREAPTLVRGAVQGGEVGEGGAPPGALGVLAEAWHPEMSGAELARALADRGVQVGERDARRLLALLRATPAPVGLEIPISSNGDRP